MHKLPKILIVDDEPFNISVLEQELEDLGYVERRRNPDDRRLHALYLTPSGKKALNKIGELGRQHERLMTAGLDTEQHDTLRQLLAVIAERQGLTPHVHPGYRTLGRVKP